MIGKILGGIIGFLFAGGIWGAFFGIILGHFLFDFKRYKSPKNFANYQNDGFEKFVMYLSQAAAKISKASGVIRPDEIDEINRIFAEMRLAPEMRNNAIKIFRSTKNNKRTLFEISQKFAAEIPQANAHFDYLTFLVRIAAAKGTIYAEEMRELKSASSAIGIPQQVLNEIISNVLNPQNSQGSNYSNQARQMPLSRELKDAYATLGLNENANFSEVKSAYRKKCKELHPDVLRSKGLGESALKVLENELRKVSDAYTLIEKYNR